MIPKIIHYCWFGRNPKPDAVVQCIQSWHQFLPDYEIREWNEDNFNLSSSDFTQQAAQAKKWAFVSDYVRVWALNKFGGIYLDSDIMVYQSFDIFLNHSAFTGFESAGYPFTAVWGSLKGHPLTKQLLSIYEKKNFLLPDGKYDIVPNTKRIAELISEYGINRDFDGLQFGDEGLVVYPSYVFCLDLQNPFHYSTHLFTGTWVKENEKKIEMQKYLMQKYSAYIKNLRYNQRPAGEQKVNGAVPKSALRRIYYWLKRRFPRLFE
jgi:Mannosyltransferase OCH1 and related enzymes